MDLRPKDLAYALLASFCVTLFAISYLVPARDAHALSNPITKGWNYDATARLTPRRINAIGKNCAVTITNFNDQPVCTGYGTGNPDAGTFDGGSCTNGINICSDTSTASKRCVNTWFVRDSVPDSIWYRVGGTGYDAGAGMAIGIEVAGGCTSP